MKAPVSRGRFVARALVILSVAAPLALAGCEDPDPVGPDRTGPCAPALACQVSGPDLVVGEPVVLWPEGQAIDEVTGYRVLQPGESVDVEVRIWNRGDETTEAIDFMTLASDGTGPDAYEGVVPALAPGAAFVDTVQLVAPSFMYNDRDTTRFHVALAADSLLDDPIYPNDFNNSETFHVALPVLHATIVAPDTMRIGDSYEVTVTIENVGRHASLPAGQIYFCWFDFDTGCGLGNIGVPFGLSPRDAIAAESEWSWTGSVEIPLMASYWDESWDWSMYVCFAATGETVEEIADDLFGWTCRDDGIEITALPNLEETCDVTVIAPDSVVSSGDGVLCDPIENPVFEAFRVDALAGITYELAVSSGFVFAIDANGERLESPFSFEEDSPVYIIARDNGSSFELRRP